MPIDSAISTTVREAAAAFGFCDKIEISRFGKGLINDTFLVQAEEHSPLLLQKINTNIFPFPLDIQTNYVLLSDYLKQKNYFLPELIKTTDQQLLWTVHGEAWRAFAFVENSYSPDPAQTGAGITAVAQCFGQFSTALKDFPAAALKSILPRFHDLSLRYQQFEEALNHTRLKVNGELKQVVEQLQHKAALVKVYQQFQDPKRFPLHVMHHDCKLSNILFDKNTHQVICPVDLDTVMPGKFYSDLGDMIRTGCCTVDENSTAFDRIDIHTNAYEQLVATYRDATAALFNEEEKAYFSYAGLLLVYMQALRFLTDHLNGDTYYKVAYPQQNFYRAKNQLLLLLKLEDYLLASGGLKQPYPAEK